MSKSHSSTRPSFSGMREDIFSAGVHLLSGAGGDIKALVQQAVQRMVGDAYVDRQSYESLLVRVEKLEALHRKPTSPLKKQAKKPAKTSVKRSRK